MAWLTPSLFHQTAVAPAAVLASALITRTEPEPGPSGSHVAVRSPPGKASRGTREFAPVSVSRAPVASPPPCMYPLAGVPPSSLAFSFGTCTLLLTFSGGVVDDEDRLSAVPLVLDSEVTAVAAFGLPKMKSPPVAATAVPDMAKNSAIREMTVA